MRFLQLKYLLMRHMWILKRNKLKLFLIILSRWIDINKACFSYSVNIIMITYIWNNHVLLLSNLKCFEGSIFTRLTIRARFRLFVFKLTESTHANPFDVERSALESFLLGSSFSSWSLPLTIDRSRLRVSSFISVFCDPSERELESRRITRVRKIRRLSDSCEYSRGVHAAIPFAFLASVIFELRMCR